MEAKTVSELPEKQGPVTLKPAQLNPPPPPPAQPPTPLQLPPHLQVYLKFSIKKTKSFFHFKFIHSPGLKTVSKSLL